MREPDDRLSRLDSYQGLPLPLRRAVRLHLIHNLPVKEAMRLAGRDRNVNRDWNRPAVQAALAEYGSPDTDWVAKLAEIEALMAPPDPPKMLESAPGAVSPPHTSTSDSLPLRKSLRCQNDELELLQTKVLTDGEKQPQFGLTDPQPPETAQTGEVILGGEYGIRALDLFPGITGENVQFWRQTADAEADERRRLIALLQSRDEPTF